MEIVPYDDAPQLGWHSQPLSADEHQLDQTWKKTKGLHNNKRLNSIGRMNSALYIDGFIGHMRLTSG